MICEPHDNSAIEWLETTRGTDAVFAVNQSAKTYLRTIVPPGNYSKSGGHVIIISACASDSKNYESRDLLTMTDYGTLSLCISKMLDKKIPFAQWPEFFRSGSYRKLEVFPPYQVPVVKEIKPRRHSGIKDRDIHFGCSRQFSDNTVAITIIGSHFYGRLRHDYRASCPGIMPQSYGDICCYFRVRETP